MNCPKCKTKCRDDALFCPNCGEKMRDAINQQEDEEVQKKKPQPQPDYVKNPPKKKFKWGCGCAIILVVVLLVTAIAGFGIFKLVTSYFALNEITIDTGNNGSNNGGSNGGSNGGGGTVIPPDQPVKVDINSVIDDYIDSNSNAYDISVSVINNKTGEEYNSKYYNDQKAAWGFYLPVYYVYGGVYGYNDPVANGIMSSNVATCNAKGNEAISKIGGISSLNTVLKNNGFTATSFGKLFGQSASVGMNYTNTYDAVKMLKFMCDNSKETLLSNKIGDFGVVAPSGATMYAQVGTENINKKENLNVFAVVKSNNCDYCIAVMTTNSQGNVINGLLQAVHDGMMQQ